MMETLRLDKNTSEANESRNDEKVRIGFHIEVGAMKESIHIAEK
jgi:hypothetical protein